MKKLALVALFVGAVSLASCEASPAERAVSDRLEDLVAAIANRAIEERATPVIVAKAPDVLPILDANHDGKLQLSELRDLAASPETLGLLLIALQREFLGEAQAGAAPPQEPQP
ncbi:MAG: hypothetical protein KDE27_01910 [Planctomycetes bacterium]|nr:hypothetical protein [Planctomycetota bacterium]